MNIKKTHKANLENKRPVFFQIGFVVALGILLGAFQWSSTESMSITMLNRDAFEIIDDDITPITMPPKPELPKPPLTVQPLALLLVDDDSPVDEILDVYDPELTEGTEIALADLIVDEEDTDEPFIFAEKMPEFTGGTEALMKYLAKNVRYPQGAVQNDIQGKVFVRFVVSKNGEIRNATIARGVHEWLDAEALRVVSSMPPWSPGMQRGLPVNVYFTVPINFKLQ